MRIFNTSGACIPEEHYTIMREALVAQGDPHVAEHRAVLGADEEADDDGTEAGDGEARHGDDAQAMVEQAVAAECGDDELIGTAPRWAPCLAEWHAESHWDVRFDSRTTALAHTPAPLAPAEW